MVHKHEKRAIKTCFGMGLVFSQSWVLMQLISILTVLNIKNRASRWRFSTKKKEKRVIFHSNPRGRKSITCRSVKAIDMWRSEDLPNGLWMKNSLDCPISGLIPVNLRTPYDRIACLSPVYRSKFIADIPQNKPTSSLQPTKNGIDNKAEKMKPCRPSNNPSFMLKWTS